LSPNSSSKRRSNVDIDTSHDSGKKRSKSDSDAGRAKAAAMEGPQTPVKTGDGSSSQATNIECLSDSMLESPAFIPFMSKKPTKSKTKKDNKTAEFDFDSLITTQSNYKADDEEDKGVRLENGVKDDGGKKNGRGEESGLFDSEQISILEKMTVKMESSLTWPPQGISLFDPNNMFCLLDGATLARSPLNCLVAIFRCGILPSLATKGGMGVMFKTILSEDPVGPITEDPKGHDSSGDDTKPSVDIREATQLLLALGIIAIEDSLCLGPDSLTAFLKSVPHLPPLAFMTAFKNLGALFTSPLEEEEIVNLMLKLPHIQNQSNLIMSPSKSQLRSPGRPSSQGSLPLSPRKSQDLPTINEDLLHPALSALLKVMAGSLKRGVNDREDADKFAVITWQLLWDEDISNDREMLELANQSFASALSFYADMSGEERKRHLHHLALVCLETTGNHLRGSLGSGHRHLELDSEPRPWDSASLQKLHSVLIHLLPGGPIIEFRRFAAFAAIEAALVKNGNARLSSETANPTGFSDIGFENLSEKSCSQIKALPEPVPRKSLQSENAIETAHGLPMSLPSIMAALTNATRQLTRIATPPDHDYFRFDCLLHLIDVCVSIEEISRNCDSETLMAVRPLLERLRKTQSAIRDRINDLDATRVKNHLALVMRRWDGVLQGSRGHKKSVDMDLYDMFGI